MKAILLRYSGLRERDRYGFLDRQLCGDLLRNQYAFTEQVDLL